jgi:uncharacterized protein (DUF2235 family)
MARNLISLIDGTMVSAARTDEYRSYSNVFELACLLQLTDKSKDGSPQIVFYTSGISSQPDNSNVFNLMTGNSIKSQIVDQYTNICANFDFAAAEAGRQDKIYLFGFSRGAMAVRAVAGLIAEFGLVYPRDIRHLPRILDAWDRGQGRGSLPDNIQLFPVEIEFIGVFDSVMGGIEKMRLFNPIRFSNARMPGRIRNAVQMLAIDENRSFFKPKQWDKAEAGIDATGRATGAPFLRQIWMPGVHSDIGGTGDPFWGRASLLAMTFYLDKRTDLRLEQKWIEQKESNLRNSFDGPFHIRTHRGFFARHTRQPVREPRAKERIHPICDEIPSVNYDGAVGFDWREKVFRPHFDKVRADKELVDYFRRILRPRASTNSRQRPVLAVAGGREVDMGPAAGPAAA